MKHTKLLLVIALVCGGYTMANAQSSDSRTYVDQDAEKLETIQQSKYMEPEEVAKAQLQEAKVQKALDYLGLVDLPNWDYDPQLGAKENKMAWKAAAERLKMRDYATYQQLGLDQ